MVLPVSARVRPTAKPAFATVNDQRVRSPLTSLSLGQRRRTSEQLANTIAGRATGQRPATASNEKLEETQATRNSGEHHLSSLCDQRAQEMPGCLNGFSKSGYISVPCRLRSVILARDLNSAALVDSIVSKASAVGWCTIRYPARTTSSGMVQSSPTVDGIRQSKFFLTARHAPADTARMPSTLSKERIISSWRQ